LLLCDEPTGNLDSKSSADLLDLFEKLNQEGLTLVIVTHDEKVANRASRRVHIVDGSLTDITNGDNRKKSPSPPPISVKTGAVARSGITLRDLFNEALAGMFARPWRMVLTMLGIVIGLTALVATLGLSATANNRIISQFDELAATGIVITAKPGPAGVDPKTIPWDAPARLGRLNGTVASGTLSEVNIGGALVSSSLIKDPRSQTAFKLSVKAASPDLFAAVRADLETGRFPDLGHSDRADRVAVLGPAAALRLGIVGLEQLPAIAIGDKLYLVIGILRGVGRQPDLLGSVIIPEGAARRDFGLVGPGSVIVETRIGAASLIADQSPLALRPDNPRILRIDFPREPQRVRDAVQSDLNVTFLLLGALSLIVGAIGIANIMLVSVMERVGEIGLRRALGATRGHIAAQFLFESTSLGVVGGILGASIGVLIVVAVSIFQGWTPVLDPSAPFLAPLIGGVIGLVSGTYPALRAARLEPVEAFRN
jgi:macrolide transport system ATP-binding/permease protein